MKPANGSRGRGRNRNRKTNAKDQIRDHVKKLYKISNAANPPNFIGKKQVGMNNDSNNPTGPRKSLRIINQSSSSINDHPSPTLKRRRAPKRFQSPDIKIDPPKHLKEMDLAMSILLEGKNSIPYFDKEEYDTALEIIIRLRNSAANCENYPCRQPESRTLIRIGVHEEAMAKQKLEFEKKAEELVVDRNLWQLKAEEMTKLKLESEDKSRELTVERDHWKVQTEEMFKLKTKLDGKIKELTADLDNCKLLEEKSKEKLVAKEKKPWNKMTLRDFWQANKLLERNTVKLPDSCSKSSIRPPILDSPSSITLEKLSLNFNEDNTNMGTVEDGGENVTITIDDIVSKISSDSESSSGFSEGSCPYLDSPPPRIIDPKPSSITLEKLSLNCDEDDANMGTVQEDGENVITEDIVNENNEISSDSESSSDFNDDLCPCLDSPPPRIIDPKPSSITLEKLSLNCDEDDANMGTVQEDGENVIIDDIVNENNEISSDSESSSDFNDDLCPCLDSPPPRIIDPEPPSAPELKRNVDHIKNRNEPLAEFGGNSRFRNTGNNSSSSHTVDEKSEKGKMQTKNPNERKPQDKNTDAVKPVTTKSMPATGSSTAPSFSRTNALTRTSKSSPKPAPVVCSACPCRFESTALNKNARTRIKWKSGEELRTYLQIQNLQSILMYRVCQKCYAKINGKKRLAEEALQNQIPDQSDDNSDLDSIPDLL